MNDYSFLLLLPAFIVCSIFGYFLLNSLFPISASKQGLIDRKPKTIKKTTRSMSSNISNRKTIESSENKRQIGYKQINRKNYGFRVIDFEQGSKDWLKWRHEGIGASNAPTIMGDNKFESPEELLHQKNNKIDIEPNEKMLMGTKLEPEARELYIKKTGINVKPLCLQDDRYPWLIASMDGISDDFQQIVEIKCGQSAYWQARKGIVPEYYYGQLQHQMMITRLDEVDYWCYWPGYRGILQTVKRDDPYIKLLMEAEVSFQRRMH